MSAQKYIMLLYAISVKERSGFSLTATDIVKISNDSKDHKDFKVVKDFKVFLKLGKNTGLKNSCSTKNRVFAQFFHFVQGNSPN